MKTITESEMNFGKLNETELFHIEDSNIYQSLGSGIKMVEFILRQNKNSIIFLEAKKSCPNAANRHESEKRKKNLKNIIDRYQKNSLNLSKYI